MLSTSPKSWFPLAPMKRVNYELSDFANDGTLKISLPIWLTSAFLARHILLLLMGGLSSFVMRGGGIDTDSFSALYSRPIFLIASIPAVAVIVAGLRRAPQAGPLIRNIWHHGRFLLLVAAGFDIGLLATAFLDVYAIAYIYRSARVRDTFSDFPAPYTEDARSKN